MLLNNAYAESTTATYTLCYVSITGSGPAPSDTAVGGYNRGAGMPADPIPIANGGTGASTAAEARANLGIGGGISQFTYLVDSNAKLADWANNMAGQDYTSVLIAPGTWTSAKEVNLATSGTKVVVGMPGSLLSFTSDYGLRYSGTTTDEYRMEGVNVKGINIRCFYNCTNLTNCTGEITSTNSTNYNVFGNCTNLTNCTATITSTASNYNYGFNNCTNLTNCTVTATTGVADGYSNYGFSDCTNLTNCTTTATGSYSFHSFSGCTNLTNCTGRGVNGIGFSNCTKLTDCNATGGNIGFNNCKNLVNCIGSIYSTNATAYGFIACTNIINCQGDGRNSSGNGYGFYQCTEMLLNRPYSISTTATYQTCYVSNGGNQVADTAAGGWNKV
jgi:hypothetical protein